MTPCLETWTFLPYLPAGPACIIEGAEIIFKVRVERQNILAQSQPGSGEGEKYRAAVHSARFKNFSFSTILCTV